MADGVIGTLRAILTASAVEFKRGFDDAVASTEKLESSSKKLGLGIIAVNNALELLQKGFGAIRAVGSALTAPLDAANEADRAIVSLEAALKAAGNTTPGFVADLENLATAQSRVSGVSDETVLNVEKQLVAFKATSAELPKLVQASLDFSTKTGDAASAAFILGRALDGETARLGQYGIFLEQGSTRTERLDQLVQQISARFGGQAAAAASTYAGRISVLKTQIQESLETLGSFVTRNTAVLSVVNSITAGVVKLTSALEAERGPIEAIVTGLVSLGKVKLEGAVDFLAATAKANNLPTLAAVLGAVSGAFRTGAGSAEQFKAQLTAAQDQVERGVGGAITLGNIYETVGSRGERSFKTIDAAVDGANKKYQTLTELLQAKPAEIAVKLADEAKSLLPSLNDLRDRLANFAVDVGAKMGELILSALGNALKAIPGKILAQFGPETDFPIRLDLDESEKKLKSIEDRLKAGQTFDIQAETTAAAAKLADLQKQTLALKDESERAPILVRIEADTARLAKLGADVSAIRFEATKPATLPITADTTSIREKVRAEEAATVQSFERLSADFKKLNPEIKFKLDAIDTKPLTDASDKAAELKTNLDRVGSDKIEAQVTADTAPAEGKIDALKNSPPRIVGDVSLSVDPSAQKKLDDLQAEAAKPATKHVDADTTAANAKVDSLAARITGALGRLLGPSEAGAAEIPTAAAAPVAPAATARLTVTTDLSAARRDLDAFSKEADAATRPRVLDVETGPGVAKLEALRAEASPTIIARVDADTAPAIAKTDALIAKLGSEAAAPIAITVEPREAFRQLDELTKRKLAAGEPFAINATVETKEATTDLDKLIAKAKEIDFLAPTASVRVVGATEGEAALARVIGIAQEKPVLDVRATTENATTKLAEFEERVARLDAVKAVSISADIAKATAPIEDLAARVARLDAVKPTIQVDAVTAPAQTRVETLAERVARLDAIKPTIAVDAGQITAASEKAAALDGSIIRLGSKSAEIKLTADTKQPTEALDELRLKTTGLEAKIPVDADASAASPKIDALQSKAEAPATKRVDADTTAATAKVDSLSARIAGALGSLFTLREAAAADIPTATPTPLPPSAGPIPAAVPLPTPGPSSVESTQREAAARQQLAAAAERQLVAETAITQNMIVQQDQQEALARDVARFNELNPTRKITLNTDDIDKATKKFTVMQITVDHVEQPRTIHIDANIAGVIDKLGVIESDITAGVDPLTIKAETTAAQQKLDELKKKLSAVRAEGNAGIELTIKADEAKLDAAQAKLTALQAEAEKPAVKPVSADTSEALKQVAELEARIEANVGRVAHGGGEIFGPAATRGDITATINQAVQATAQAIKSGDRAQLADISANLRDFLNSFGRLPGSTGPNVPSDIASAASAIETAIQRAGLGAIGFSARAETLGTGPQAILSQAIADAQKAQTGKQDETNTILRQSKDVAEKQLAATQNVEKGLASGSFATDMLKRQQAAQLLSGAVR
jgi:hypothetical protein